MSRKISEYFKVTPKVQNSAKCDKNGDILQNKELTNFSARRIKNKLLYAILKKSYVIMYNKTIT